MTNTSQLRTASRTYFCPGRTYDNMHIVDQFFISLNYGKVCAHERNCWTAYNTARKQWRVQEMSQGGAKITASEASGKIFCYATPTFACVNLRR